MILLLLKAWSVIRSVTGYMIDLFMRYPLQFTIILLCLYIYWQKTRIDNITHEYMTYKSDIAYKYELQKVQNNILRKQAEQVFNDVMAVHKDYLTTEKLDRKRVEDKLKGSINEISNELNIYRDSIRLRNESTSSIDVSKVAEHTSGTADTKSNCNQTLATVVDACKVTDYDYEALYNLYKRQCDIFGCE